jgi:hypothetical protein
MLTASHHAFLLAWPGGHGNGLSSLPLLALPTRLVHFGTFARLAKLAADSKWVIDIGAYLNETK